MVKIWPASAGTFVATDTSAIINLNATGSASAIIRAWPARIAVVEAVSEELKEGRRSGKQDADRLSELVNIGLIEIVQLGVAGQRYFEDLAIGPASLTLDDGEAATIAYALESGISVLLDERKATRICTERYPQLSVGTSVDVLLHPAINAALGNDIVVEAIFNALHRGRMRVPSAHLNRVIELIGKERAAMCTSLPRAARV